MKNKELIELLSKCDPEATALVCVKFSSAVDANFQIKGVDPVGAFNAVYVEAARLGDKKAYYNLKLDGIMHQMERDDLIDTLKKIALDNYENGGDGMVECWDRRQWVGFILDCKSSGKDPLKYIYESMSTYKSIVEDIQNS